MFESANFSKSTGMRQRAKVWLGGHGTINVFNDGGISLKKFGSHTMSNRLGDIPIVSFEVCYVQKIGQGRMVYVHRLFYNCRRSAATRVERYVLEANRQSLLKKSGPSNLQNC